ncbi:MAG: hypothetical protein LBS50_07455, partial [Prevotellaceae bacterium]|nr:hypothetical protein [Prevotellaceae bacterium]
IFKLFKNKDLLHLTGAVRGDCTPQVATCGYGYFALSGSCVPTARGVRDFVFFYQFKMPNGINFWANP